MRDTKAAVLQSGLLMVSLVSNVVRHTRIPATPGVPKSAFLTVQTLTVQVIYLTLSTIAAWGCPLAVAHRFDAFVVAQGAVLWLAYYSLVHWERTFRANGARFIFWNNVVHAPTIILPALSAAVKDPALLAAHGASTATTCTLAVVYGAIYAWYITKCETKLHKPYEFMRHLTTTPSRIAFWGTGILIGVVPITLLSTAFVHRLSVLG